jgi:DNA-binding HxlR family transcriptional regulator
MDGYNQFCPIARAAEVLARRWTPLVVRELLWGSHRFNDLHRGLPRMSRTLLSHRLSELEEAGVLERRIVGGDEHPEYHLTRAGEALRPAIVELGRWGKRWLQRELSDDELDAGLLMWNVRRRIERERLPPRRVVAHFRFTDAPLGTRDFWLVLEREAVDLYLEDPGYEEALFVRSDVRTLTEVWLGELDLRRAIDERSLLVAGPTGLRREFPEWLGLSVFAGITSEADARRVRQPEARGIRRGRRPARTLAEREG